MPGRSFDGPLPPLSQSQAEAADRLKQDVYELAEHIGERNIMDVEGYHQAADYIEKSLSVLPISTTRQSYAMFYGVNEQGRHHFGYWSDGDGKPLLESSTTPGDQSRKVICYNLIGELTGTKKPDEIIVVGAHYDSLVGTVGADDNASGVAVVLELARRLASRPPPRTVRFVAFANEEPPFFRLPLMGSWRYAESCRESGDRIEAMVSIDGVGYYSDQRGSQRYPMNGEWLYPDKANFVCFVGDSSLSSPVRRAVGTFRKSTRFPSVGVVAPRWVEGVGWSDHLAFWENGYPASFMVTDTIPFRYEHYHRKTDTADRLDYERMARVVDGLEAVIRDLAGGDD